MHNQEETQHHVKTVKRFYFSPALVRRRRRQKEREEEESLKPKVIEGQNTGYVGACYHCPLSNVEFRGSCPITPCNYNITNYKTERSCCLAIETQKMEFDKWDLQEALGISESKLYKLKEKGELNVKALISFYSILSGLRDKNVNVKSTGNIANFMDNSYLNMEEIQARKSDVYLIQENLEDIREQASKIDPRLTLEKVLGTTERITT